MTFRVLTAELWHETNTFSRLLTGKQAPKDRFVRLGDEAIAARREANTELSGFLDADGVRCRELAHRSPSCSSLKFQLLARSRLEGLGQEFGARNLPCHNYCLGNIRIASYTQRLNRLQYVHSQANCGARAFQPIVVVPDAE